MASNLNNDKLHLLINNVKDYLTEKPNAILLVLSDDSVDLNEVRDIMKDRELLDIKRFALGIPEIKDNQVFFTRGKYAPIILAFPNTVSVEKVGDDYVFNLFKHRMVFNVNNFTNLDSEKLNEVLNGRIRDYAGFYEYMDKLVVQYIGVPQPLILDKPGNKGDVHTKDGVLYVVDDDPNMAEVVHMNIDNKEIYYKAVIKMLVTCGKSITGSTNPGGGEGVILRKLVDNADVVLEYLE